ncbi:ABC transporter ATP-binding protein [Thermodesulfobacteriota bacterium]
MSDTMISVENLSKRYRIGAKARGPKTFREAITDGITSPLRNLRRLRKLTDFSDVDTKGKYKFPRPSHYAPIYMQSSEDDIIWALKDISFNVMRGEVVGIIGRNGTGKTTLLKILSRITEPTSGDIKLYGRVSSLLEVGTGFHPELTGRENIYLNGAILGMSRAEINLKLNEIIDFAGIEKFIDTPVKRYSSGMYVRLAFAVAAHLEPEILLVDEVLAVGDISFQKECLGKMNDVAKKGRTVLFVSHNMLAIQSLCQRVLLLNNGTIVKDGQSNLVVSDYLKQSLAIIHEQSWDDIATSPGNDKVCLRRVRIRPEDTITSEVITVRTSFVVELEYWNLQPGTYLNPSLFLYNEQGTLIFDTVPLHEPVWYGRSFPAGLFRSVCHVPGDLLNNGMHRFGLYFIEDQSVVILSQEDILVFEVRDSVEMHGSWYGKWPGAIHPKLKWSTELVETKLPNLL